MIEGETPKEAQQMQKLDITDEIVKAHFICKRKSYQLLFQHSSKCGKQNYAVYLNEKIADVKSRFFQPKKNFLPFISDELTGKTEIILNATIKVGNLVIKNIFLQKRTSKSKLGSFSYEPLVFIEANKVRPEDKAVLSYIGYVLQKYQGLKPDKAVVILIDDCVKSIKLNKDVHSSLINELNEWSDSKPDLLPPIYFNKHCSICPFEQNCISVAEKADSLSLLGKMTPKILKKYESKGIFTITQLSYIYRPRRRSSRWGEGDVVHQFELQALALRTKEIYTTELLKLPKAEVEIFIDIESIPEQQFHYLIGIVISKQGVNQVFSFWADDASEEKKIWQNFVKTVNYYPEAPIFHYGNYEQKVITELSKRYNGMTNEILDRLCNVNKYIYGRIYFPTRTNRLKDLCNYLGFTWTEKGLSGLDSIAWRYTYDKTHTETIKADLILYNEEDNLNLKKLKDAVGAICTSESALPDVKSANNENQLLSPDGRQIVDGFSALIKSAHGKYEQSKITLGKKKKEAYKKRNAQAIPKSKIDKEIRVARRRVCPVHHRPLMPTELVSEHIILDLVCTPKGIKKTTIKYWGYRSRCPNCSHRYIPSAITRMGKLTKYGYGLKAWVTYQRMVMRLPFRKITQLLEDTFNIVIVIASGGINSLFKSVSNSYIKTEKNILNEILKSSKIHADETLVNIQGKNQYVWVFTDGEYVIFRLTETRDSTIVHEVLKGYKGVLISDFFSGYDAVECHQQKCWVHLIRDINEDIRKSPFDLEYEMFVLVIRELITPIFETVEKYGLKQRNLNKFKKKVEKFYKQNIDDHIYKSDITKRYQKRFSRYRSSLFVFLEQDGIPWNNNMAERALRHLAVQRKISGSFFATGMTNYLILLGIMQTCRFQNKPFLEFLMSGKKDINSFKGKKNIKGWEMN